jgi:hypothetical protein
MCKLVFAGGIYYFVMLCLILFVPHFSDRRKDISDTLKPEGAGIVGFLILSVLSLSSLPLGWPMDLIGKLKPTIKFRLIETWVLSLTLLNLLLLFLALDRWPWFLVFPALTIADSAYAMIYLLIKWQSVHSPARSLLLDVLRYFQVIVAFAGLFLGAHHLSNSAAFCKAGGAIQELPPGQALYFSAVTATTVGSGDMVPCLPGSQNLVFLLRPTTLIPVEIFCIVLILAIEIPRIISNQIAEATQS